MTGLFTDNNMVALEVALNGIAERQRVTAHNISNVNTPNFRASRVEFEDQLATALRRGEGVDRVGASKVRANTPVNMVGNDVALELETQELMKSGLTYDALVGALNHRFSVLRSAIGGR